MGLRWRMLLLLLVAVVPSFVVLAIGALQTRADEVAERQAELERDARSAAHSLHALIDGAHQMLALLGRIEAFRRQDRAACEQTLRELLVQSPEYLNIGAVDSDGKYLCNALPTPPTATSAADRSWFTRALATRAFAIGDYQIGKVTGKASINFGLPVLAASGEIEQVLYAALDLAGLQRGCDAAEVPVGAVVVLVDQNGAVLARRPGPADWVGKQMAEAAVVKAILAQRTGMTEVAGIDGVRRFFAFTPVAEYGDGGIYVGVGLTREFAVAIADRNFTRMFVALAVAALFSTAATWFVTDRALLQRIRRMIEATRGVGAGDKTLRVTTGNERDELGELARAFNEMADSLQARKSERQLAEQQIQQLNRDLERRVTERTAQLAATNKELEAFSYSISHDLRAPLRHINGFVSMLRASLPQDISDKSRRHLDTIQASSARMGLLIDDILTFARVGRAELRRSKVDLKALVDDVWNDMQPDVERREVDFTVGPLPTVVGDEVLLRQVFVNLLSNAVKFTRPRAHATIELDCEPGAPGEVGLIVRDNGVGFDMQYAGKLFGVFQRLHSGDDFEGTGIGLAIVQRVIHRHGGRAWAQAVPDRGASFHITLPVQGPIPWPTSNTSCSPKTTPTTSS